MSEIKTNSNPRLRRLSSGELKATRFLISNVELYLRRALDQKSAAKIHEQIRIALSNLETAQRLTNQEQS